MVIGFWCLKLHSILFHWYHGGQFVGGGEQSTEKATSSWLPLSHETACVPQFNDHILPHKARQTTGQWSPEVMQL